MGQRVQSIAGRVLVGAAAAVMVAVAAPGAHATPPAVEPWVQAAVTTYPTIAGIYVTQGIASDGASLFFSYKFGVLRAGLDGTLDSPPKPSLIPPALSAQGGDHIGDIDVHAGKVYAPVEDGNAGYLHPFIALYDAATMAFTGTSWALDRSVLTEGVPWVAVDASRGKLYTAEWNDTEMLNVHDLDDPAVVSTVALHPPTGTTVGRIQGAKMLDGLLYAAEDNGDAKSIVAIDPVSGDVTPVFDRNLGADTEAEGIAFVHTPTGVLMCTTEIAPGLAVKLRVYRRQGDPVTSDPTACLPAPPVIALPAIPDPVPDPLPAPPTPPPPPHDESPVVPKPKPAANPLTAATAKLLRGARVQLAAGTKGKWKTVTKRRSGGRTSYRVRVTSGSTLLATGTVKARRLTLDVRRSTSATNRTKLVALVRKRISDLRGAKVRRT